MVKTYAIVKNGKVVNIALADKAIGPDWIEAKGAAIGDSYVNGEFTKQVQKPAEPSPIVAKKDRIDALIDLLVFNGALSADDAETLKTQR